VVICWGWAINYIPNVELYAWWQTIIQKLQTHVGLTCFYLFRGEKTGMHWNSGRELIFQLFFSGADCITSNLHGVLLVASSKDHSSSAITSQNGTQCNRMAIGIFTEAAYVSRQSTVAIGITWLSMNGFGEKRW